MSEMSREEAKQEMYPELYPLLTLQIPKDWEMVTASDGHTTYGVRFYYNYKGKQRGSVQIDYWSETKRDPYQTWFERITDRRYPTLQEAIERIQYTMTVVVRQAHWEDIAFVKDSVHESRLGDRNGIGGETIMALLDRFITLDSLRGATIEDLEAVKGIGSDRAWLIASHLHDNIRHHKLWDPAKGEWVSLYRVPKEVIDQCVRTRTYVTQAIRNKYRLTQREIKERGLVKVRVRDR